MERDGKFGPLLYGIASSYHLKHHISGVFARESKQKTLQQSKVVCVSDIEPQNDKIISGLDSAIRNSGHSYSSIPGTYLMAHKHV